MKGDWAMLGTVFRKMEESKFFTNDKNWCKVAEGNYDNRVESGKKTVPTAKPNDEWQ